MKATDLLKKQHKSVKALSNELKMHTQIEEEIFYPAVLEIGSSKAEEMVDESYEEHHVVDLVLAEEDEMFPVAGKKLGKERLQQLGEQMERMAGGQRRAA